jgi:ATP-binding cassette subfamily B protein
MANTFISFVIILPLMFELHANLTWAFLALVPIVMFFVISLSGKLKAYQVTVQELLGKLSNFIEQNLSGIHIIKAYAQEEAEVKRFSIYNDELKEAYMKLVSIRSFIGPVMRVIASLGFVLLLYIGGKSVIDQDFSSGDFAAYSLYIQRLIWPVATLGWMITVIYRAQVSYQRISNILDIKPTILDKDNAIEKLHLDNSIELKSLGVTINKGSNVAVIGTIGSGKSILAHKLMHLKELADNEILIDGIDLNDIKLNSLRTMINLVIQEDFLFSTSIHENIAYAKDLSEEEVIQLAKMVNIHDEIMKLPHGYSSVVGERGVTLSGGQRQRIAIARALALDSDVLVLDDALSSLDNSSSALVLNNILKMRKGRTTIFITHKIPIVKDMDQIIVMDKFKVVESGTHKELMRDGTLYKELVEHTQHE